MQKKILIAFICFSTAFIGVGLLTSYIGKKTDLKKIETETIQKPAPFNWVGQFQHTESEEGFHYFFQFNQNEIIVISLEDPSINTIFTGKWVDKWTFSADIGEGNFLIRVGPTGVYYFEFNTITKKFKRYEPNFPSLQLDSCTIDRSTIYFYR